MTFYKKKRHFEKKSAEFTIIVNLLRIYFRKHNTIRRATENDNFPISI